jgi:hypothetical protein
LCLLGFLDFFFGEKVEKVVFVEINWGSAVNNILGQFQTETFLVGSKKANYWDRIMVFGWPVNFFWQQRRLGLDLASRASNGGFKIFTLSGFSRME